MQCLSKFLPFSNNLSFGISVDCAGHLKMAILILVSMCESLWLTVRQQLILSEQMWKWSSMWVWFLYKIHLPSSSKRIPLYFYKHIVCVVYWWILAIILTLDPKFLLMLKRLKSLVPWQYRIYEIERLVSVILFSNFQLSYLLLPVIDT